MKTLRLAILPLLLAALGGCASGPYYYGGTSYRTPGGLMVSPNIVVSPTFVDWKK